MRGSTQLTREQRYQIHPLVQTGQNHSQMATVVGVHTATISRELRRNRGRRGYRPHQAHRLAQARPWLKTARSFDFDHLATGGDLGARGVESGTNPRPVTARTRAHDPS